MNLRELRKQNGMTQQELATSLGVKNTTVSMWETGKSSPSTKIIVNMSRYLNCSIEELVNAISCTAKAN